MKYTNPIIKGYHPDPSICRVNDDYYLLNSTFEWYPGLPIYHSKNLINWDLIGYCMTNQNGLDLTDCPPSGGLFAPTIRYWHNRFYVTVTNVTHGGNLIIHADNINGPWSEPVFVDQGGIDPSFLFDDDGKVYYTTAVFDEGNEGIYICEINPDTGEKNAPTRFLTKGCGGRYAEGPHLYKLFGKYYLMLAEGGTEYAHSETMMRADSPYGPFEPCPNNPILTNRDVMNEDIKCTGHADLVDDTNGNWWLVHLGVRPKSTPENRTLLHNIGRETFLVSLRWDENQWPQIGCNGTVLLNPDEVLPGPAPTNPCYDFKADFSECSLQWAFLRNPKPDLYQFNGDHLRLVGTSDTLQDLSSPAFLGIRQPEYVTSVETVIVPESGVSGLSAYYANQYHYDICVEKCASGIKLYLRKALYDNLIESAPVIIKNSKVSVKIESDHEWYRFYYQDENGCWIELGKGMTAGLCTEVTHIMTFTGVILGLFAENGTSNFYKYDLKARLEK